MISEQEAREAAKTVLRGWDGHFRPYSHREVAAHKAATWITEELARREWKGEPDGEGWYWCEELDSDAPPQKIVKHVIGVDASGNDIQPAWKRWTVAGWVNVVGRVCKITERPA